MEAVLGLLLMLLGVCHGVETYCDGRQSGAQCYGALGGTVVFRLMDDASEIPGFVWKKETNIFRWIDNKIRLNVMKDRSLFIPSNGTLRINNINRGDSGEYKLEMFDSQRRTAGTRTLQFTIEGVETYCDGRQSGAQCYGALGGTVVFRLMDDASEIPEFAWKKETKNIFRWIDNKIRLNVMKDRSLFIPSNGTLRINNINRGDSGEYKLEMFDSQRRTAGTRTLQFTVQAPVSSVQLVSECLSQGEMKVSCSPNGGGSLQYSWTLDGHTLRDTELLSGNNETNVITLKQNVSGRLVCSVRNQVSSVSKEEDISTCGVETYCDGRQSGAQCYGALGGTVVFRLMDDASEIPEFAWKKERQNILRWIDNKIILNKMKHRSLFSHSNGTLRINNINRGDSGEYKLEMFDSQRRTAGTRTLQFTVEAPVSSVQLASECLSQGEMKVSCSPNGGDSLQYSWTLDGHTLRDTELLSGNNETNVLTLKQDVSGRLVCSVRNQVSSVSKEEDISTCGFIFIDCMSNGTRISMWVHKENKTLCDEPTTVTVGKDTESLKTSTNNSSCNQTVTLREGFIFIDCTSNGTRISMWVHKENKTLCDEPTTVTVDKDTESLKTSTKNSSCNQTVTLREGFIFIDCTSNGTRISMWVHKENKTLCDEPTTVTVDKDTESLKTSTNNSSCNQTVTLREGSSPLLICGLRTIVVILLLIGISVYFTWKKKKREKAERSAVNLEDSVLMVEMRRSAT
ncbi:matrix-remodeling-associated protein 5 isoform X17 [Melanotaenia boesemani]|uniref:matrix-remodeling-associated protein 5 isoform X17 n=1 Tax=Melanotaenia boesemani TaxID=1250792 RepID=UPI001C04567A|nr:matrix-remodeling-associated protein 5 isoform X17 [Melanotaenia boesemani]